MAAKYKFYVIDPANHINARIGEVCENDTVARERAKDSS